VLCTRNSFAIKRWRIYCAGMWRPSTPGSATATKSRWPPSNDSRGTRHRRTARARPPFPGTPYPTSRGSVASSPLPTLIGTGPKKIDRDMIQRAPTLEFITESRNLILLGSNGLGKTMLSKNIAHAAVLAGDSVLFRSASKILEDLHCDSPPSPSTPQPLCPTASALYR
jgi:hypothetical protein